MSNISEDKDFELDSNRIRRHFPLINNRNIAYLDNGATTEANAGIGSNEQLL